MKSNQSENSRSGVRHFFTLLLGGLFVNRILPSSTQGSLKKVQVAKNAVARAANQTGKRNLG